MAAHDSPSRSTPQRGVALITGAARRIGAAIARELHAAGMNVVVHYRSSGAAARKLADNLNALRADSACTLRANLLDIAHLPKVIEETLGHWGRLDALVNNASTFYATPLGKIDEAAWDDLAGSNLKAPLFLSQAAATELRRNRGCIVNLVDTHRDHPLHGYSLYCAAKAGLVTLTRALALELAPDVRVNAVAPGTILWAEGKAPDAVTQGKLIGEIPLARLGEPEEIARAVRFLVSPDAAYITGQVIAIDGGLSIGVRPTEDV
ncbi:MAG: pteridine reductase [Nevskiales bacterium]